VLKKISIIGGSIAGLTTAIQLKRLDNEFNVTVFEEHPEIGVPVRCAEGFVAHPWVEKPPDGCIDMNVEEVLYRFNFKNMPSRTYRAGLKKEGFWIIDRTKYEKMLADQCIELGVDIKTGHRSSIDELQPISDIIVDASGADPNSELSFGIQYTVRDDFSYNLNKALFEYTPDFVGYYWIFPKGPDLANVGMGWFKRERYPSGKEMKRLLEEYMYAKIIHGDIVRKTAGYIGATPRKKFYDEKKKVIYVGDAAGLADPVIGEGIGAAILSAKKAAEAIANDSLSSYQEILLRTLNPKYSIMARDIWERYGYDTFSEFLSFLYGAMTGEPVNRKRLRRILIRRPRLLSKIVVEVFSGYLHRKPRR
jgi:digeranylgeranylglycerophospholipid reductase